MRAYKSHRAIFTVSLQKYSLRVRARRWAASAIFSVPFWKGFVITYVQGRNINASSLIGVDLLTPNFQVNLNVRR